MAQKRTSPTIHEATIHEYQAALELAGEAPRPARIGRVGFGTAGWTDPTLLREGRFYPRGLRSARERLDFYAQHFPFVEVDATYYALLPPAQAEQWLTHTPDTFIFDIKAHPVLTGQPFEARRLPQDLRDALPSDAPARLYADSLPSELRVEVEARFRAFVQPLLDKGRLGAVLVQFPPWFVHSRVNVERIEQLAVRWADVPLAVEFRHSSWTNERSLEQTLAMLTRLKLTWVCVDAPAGAENDPSPGTTPLGAWAVTNPRLVVVRFHGRNARGWAQKGASVHERFSYLYTPQELQPWTQRLVEVAARAERVHATFNNCYRDYAILNAKELAVLVARSDGDRSLGVAATKTT